MVKAVTVQQVHERKQCWVLCSSVFIFLLFSYSSLSANIQEIEAITKPSADIELSFMQAGKIMEISAKEGENVKAGELLARQEDEIELIQFDVLSAKAKNTTPIELAVTELTQKQKDLKKMKLALKDGAVTDWEMEHAALAVDTALLSVKLAEFEHDQDLFEQKTIEEILNRLHLYSPINGVVEEIRAEVGESLQALKAIIRVVNIETVQVDVPVPLSVAKKLSVQQKAIVAYADGISVEGHIEYISSVADATADILNVNVLVANTSGRPVGERVKISFLAPE